MNEQQKQEFLTKLKTAIDLETDLATQAAIIGAYNDTSEKNKPKLYVKPDPQKPEEPVYVDASQIKTSTGEWIILALPFVAMVVVPILFAITRSGSYFSYLLSVLVPIGLSVASSIRIKRRVKQYNDDLFCSYEDKKRSWKKAKEATAEENRRAQIRYSDNLTDWQASKDENTAQLQSRLGQTRQLLRRLYAQNFIYDKYRTLPALTSSYEYFITGRCDELTGPHGAYNMYEDEVRKDTVISQLNLVIQHLEQIRQNQYMLYQQVNLIQRQSQQIAYELSKISSYTQNIMQLSAVSAYYSALTAKNTEISANLQLMGG